VALSAAVFENLKTESFATPAHLAALTLIFEIDAANKSGFDCGRWVDDVSLLVFPKPQYFGLPLPRPEGCSCSFEVLF
jgi:hypothetical protein